MFYLYIFLILSGFAIIDLIKKSKAHVLFVQLLVAFIFFFIAGFKYETGVDWAVYEENLDKMPSLDKLLFTEDGVFDSLNIGFDLLLATVKYFKGNIQHVFFISSLITTTFIFLAIRKYSTNSLVSFLLYYCIIFFILDMSGIRQGIALSIFFYSIQYIEQRRFIKYFLFITLATLFHWSSALLLVPYFIGKRKFHSKALIAFYIICLVIFIFNIQWLSSILLFFFPYLENALLLDKVITYTTNPALANSRGLTPFTIIFILLYTIIFIASLKNREVLGKKFKYYNVFFNLYMFHCFSFFCLSEFLDLGERLKLFFSISTIVLLPMFISLYKVALKQFLIAMCIFSYGFIVCRSYLLEMPFTIAYYPYQNYLIYKWFNLKSTGEERRIKHININE